MDPSSRFNDETSIAEREGDAPSHQRKLVFRKGEDGLEKLICLIIMFGKIFPKLIHLEYLTELVFKIFSIIGSHSIILGLWGVFSLKNVLV